MRRMGRRCLNSCRARAESGVVLARRNAGGGLARILLRMLLPGRHLLLADMGAEVIGRVPVHKETNARLTRAFAFS